MAGQEQYLYKKTRLIDFDWNIPTPFKVLLQGMLFGKKHKTIDSFGEFAWAAKNKKTDFLGSTTSPFKIAFIFIIFFLAILGLLAKAFWLQVKKGDDYLAIAENNRVRREVIPAARGLIFDRNLKSLTGNDPGFYLDLEPGLMPAEQKLATLDFLEKEFGVDPEVVEKEFMDFKKYSQGEFPILDNLDYPTALKLKIAITDYPWLKLREGKNRRYIYNGQTPSLSHALGYLSRVTKDDLEKNDQLKPQDKIGRLGVEAAYDAPLRGEDGFYEIEVDAYGNPKEKVERKKPKDGNNVVLSLDYGLQTEAEQVLRSALAAHNKKKGVVAVMNVNTGKLLAMVSWPSFDANVFSKKLTTDDANKLFNNPNLPMFNRVISGAYPSGSIIKPVYATAALAEKVIDRNTTVLSVGGFSIGNSTFPDWKAGGHGVTNVIKAIAESVNTFFYIIGGGYGQRAGMGLNIMVKYLHLFGLGQSTNLGLIGEKNGFVPTAQWKKESTGLDWFIGDTYHLAIGQGFLTVTPLQMLAATAAIANGGTLYRPSLLSKIYSDNIEQAEVFLPEVTRAKVADDQYLKIVREGMRATVTAGSARSLGNAVVPVAGKTGTAEWRTGRSTHAWFSGFAPYDSPEIAIIVLVEEGGEGSTISAPIAHQVIDWYFTHKNTSALSTK